MSRQITPYYLWATYTTNKVKIGGIDNVLKLMIRPMILYGNYPQTIHKNYTINRAGYRGKEPKNKEGKRIVLVGGSSAFGTGLNNDDETLAVQLEKSLNIEVINAAVIGHKSKNELAYLVDELLDLRPDLVMTFDGWNDCYFSYKDDNPWRLGVAGFDQMELCLEELSRIKNDNIFNRFACLPAVLFPRLSERCQIFMSKFHGSDKKMGVELEAGLQPTIAAKEYVKNIEKMAVISKAYGSEFLCVIQPIKKSEQRYDEFRQTARSMLDLKKISYLDLNDARERFSDDMFFGKAHLDARGQTLIAELISKKLNMDRA